MGKKRITTKEETTLATPGEDRAVSKISKRKIGRAVLYVQATYNNTKVSLSDEKGAVVAWSSSGSLGFKGAKKGTPFAASKVGELLGEKAVVLGTKEVDVIVSGVGSGRESAIRAFNTKGINIASIRDVTPIPHNGPRPRKPRRV